MHCRTEDDDKEGVYTEGKRGIDGNFVVGDSAKITSVRKGISCFSLHFSKCFL